jgi:hypothetical protein
MTQDEIIRMAREAEAYEEDGNFNFDEYEIKRFAALVAAAEREACAKICDSFSDDPVYCGNLIRARGQE